MLMGRGQERVGAGGVRYVFWPRSDVPEKSRGEGLHAAAWAQLESFDRLLRLGKVCIFIVLANVPNSNAIVLTKLMLRSGKIVTLRSEFKGSSTKTPLLLH